MESSGFIFFEYVIMIIIISSSNSIIIISTSTIIIIINKTFLGNTNLESPTLPKDRVSGWSLQ